jgi:hypothetical protein
MIATIRPEVVSETGSILECIESAHARSTNTITEVRNNGYTEMHLNTHNP